MIVTSNTPLPLHSFQQRLRVHRFRARFIEFSNSINMTYPRRFIGATALMRFGTPWRTQLPNVSAMSVRRMSSCINEGRLTDWQRSILSLYREGKRKDWKPVAQKPPKPYLQLMYIFDSTESNWTPAKRTSQSEVLYRGRIPRIIAWNLKSQLPDEEARAKAALEYLETVCGDEILECSVIALQGISSESLVAIKQSTWLQQHFKISTVKPPESVY